MSCLATVLMKGCCSLGGEAQANQLHCHWELLVSVCGTGLCSLDASVDSSWGPGGLGLLDVVSRSVWLRVLRG